MIVESGNMNSRTWQRTDKRTSLNGRTPKITLAGVYTGPYITILTQELNKIFKGKLTLGSFESVLLTE